MFLALAALVSGCVAQAPVPESPPPAPVLPELGSRPLYYVAKVDSSWQLQLLRAESTVVLAQGREPLMSPAVSPDGGTLAYVAYQHGTSGVYLQALKTGTLRRLTADPGINGAPAWSPDGRRLAVVLSAEGSADLYAIDVDSGERTRLTDHSAIDTEPSWSPDGTQIAFTSDRSGRPQVYLLDVATREVRVLTRQGRQNLRPRFSPDGRTLALVTYEGGFRIALVDVATGRRTLLSGGPEDESPAFSPDGQLLAYSGRGPDGQGELRVVSVDGAVNARLPGVDARDPVFAPD